MKVITYLASATVLCCLLTPAGCGSDCETSPTGTLKLQATITPDPPAVGQNTLQIEVRTASGEPVDGATVTVDPQMRVHGHGSSDEPVVEPLGQGRYKAFPVTFQMPGPWEVTVTASASGETGSTVFKYEAQ